MIQVADGSTTVGRFMAEYEYRNAAGQVRTIVASMKSPPPERVLFKASGEWMPVPTLGGVEMPYAESAGSGPILEPWTRIYSVPQMHVDRGGQVNHQNQHIPTSRSLPRTREEGTVTTLHGQPVRKLRSGAYATIDGRRIVDSHTSRRTHMKECGFEDHGS